MIWLSTTGDVLNDTQQAAFERYIQAGGGYTGIHAAADTEYTWPWYGQLVGAYFRNHPAGTPDRRDGRARGGHRRTTRRRACRHRTGTGSDEWYNYQSPVNPSSAAAATDYSPRRDVHVLITVDESTYDEDDGNTAR